MVTAPSMTGEVCLITGEDECARAFGSVRYVKLAGREIHRRRIYSSAGIMYTEITTSRGYRVAVKEKQFAPVLPREMTHARKYFNRVRSRPLLHSFSLMLSLSRSFLLSLSLVDSTSARACTSIAERRINYINVGLGTSYTTGQSK